MKRYIDINVLEASKERIKNAIESFDDFYVSFSGGKDSGVMVNLVIDVAREMDRLPVKVVFSDLEVIYQETVRYVMSIMDKPEVEPYWLCIEELDDNTSSVFERYFKIWDHTKKDLWVHPMPDKPYVIHDENMPDGLKKYMHLNDITQWSVFGIGEWFADKCNGNRICNFIGMRSGEAYGRYMAVATHKNRIKENDYTYLTKNGYPRTWTCLPIYDWEYQDVWHYYAETGKDYNHVYDSMYRMGTGFTQMRTCSAFGNEQSKTLYAWSVIEPETWDRMVTRVAGANYGKLYNHTNLNKGKVKKPDNITWKEYLPILLAELPPMARKNFEEKFDITFRYHKVMYEEKEGISPDIYIQDSRKAAREKAKETGLPIKMFISYETLCGAIIKRDFVFEKYGFGYSKKMYDRIAEIQEHTNDEIKGIDTTKQQDL